MSLGDIGPKQSGRNITGGRQLIQSYILTAATATITFNNIPQNFSSLLINAQARYNGTNARNAAMKFNNGGTYDFIEFYSNNTSVVSDTGLGTSTGAIALVPISSDAANAACSFKINIFNYATSVFNKSYLSTAGTPSSTAAQNFYYQVSGSVRSTAPVTRIDIFQSTTTDSFVAGSFFNLYGII